MADIAATFPRPAIKWYETATVGYVVLAFVVLIWAGFALTMRAIGKSPLATADVALIRFAVPAVALLPFLFGRLHLLRKVDSKAVLLVLAGGVPFYFVASEGAKLTSAAYVGALIPGTTPLAMALITRVFAGRKISGRQVLPIGLILAGVVLMVAGQRHVVTAETLRGVGLLLLASLIWAGYTIGLRRTGLQAVSNGLLLSIGSLLALVPMMLAGLTGTNLGHFTVGEALPYVLVQGVGTGLISTLGYAFAISRLGASQSATIGSLSPALTSLLAVPLLGEPLAVATAVAVVLVTFGVMLANRRGARGAE
jgi:drug/metabolite transporter (DMT)-like permease